MTFKKNRKKKVRSHDEKGKREKRGIRWDAAPSKKKGKPAPRRSVFFMFRVKGEKVDRRVDVEVAPGAGGWVHREVMESQRCILPLSVFRGRDQTGTRRRRLSRHLFWGGKGGGRKERVKTCLLFV